MTEFFGTWTVAIWCILGCNSGGAVENANSIANFLFKYNIYQSGGDIRPEHGVGLKEIGKLSETQEIDTTDAAGPRSW